MKTEEEKKKEYEAHVKDLMESIKPIGEYRDEFIRHCTEHGRRISTGLLSLDKALNGGLANELYIMGAETSTGKSAFLMSIAQKVAEEGTDVLYFALEMGRDEFIARGISSISFEHHRGDEKAVLIKASDILYWTYDAQAGDFFRPSYSTYSRYADEYFARNGGNLHIIEGGMSGLTARDIADATAIFRQNNGGKNVAVFVDYLQNIRPDPEDRAQADRKTRTDVAVATLKTLASQVGMPVIAASSISRGGYGERITAASFKESGDTEYTGGVLIGWNWTGVTDEKDPRKAGEERECCSARGYRRMELEILKYRNAARDNSVRLRYYPAYNYFEDGGEIAEDREAGYPESKTVIRG